MSGLTIGSLTLTPAFDGTVLEYATATTNASNKVTATASDEDATITITLNDTALENGSSATWAAGENTLVVEVSIGEKSTTYTVTVTKS